MMQWTSSGKARRRNGVVQCPPRVALLGRAANPGGYIPPIFDLHPPTILIFTHCWEFPDIFPPSLQKKGHQEKYLEKMSRKSMSLAIARSRG